MGVTIQIRDKGAPIFIKASCVSHRLNLVVETMFKFPMVSGLEGRIQSIYSYFCRSNKHHAELQKLTYLMETKGNKMVRNVDTRWISMRIYAARIMSEYQTLLVKMAMDMATGPGQKPQCGVADNFDLLCDIEVLLSLAIFIPLVNTIHCLIKLSQTCDIFICDFLQAVKLCQSEVERMFLDPSTAHSKADFKEYGELISLSSTEIPLYSRPIPKNNGLAHLLFNFYHNSQNCQMYARCHDKALGSHLFVTQQEFNCIQDNIERQFSKVAQLLSDELDLRFPQQELLDAFVIIYPQYWCQDGAEESFPHHLGVLKQFYATTKVFNKGQAFSEIACGPPFYLNLVLKL